MVSKQAGEEKWISVTALQIAALPKKKPLNPKKGYKVYKIQPRGMLLLQQMPFQDKGFRGKMEVLKYLRMEALGSRRKSFFSYFFFFLAGGIYGM